MPAKQLYETEATQVSHIMFNCHKNVNGLLRFLLDQLEGQILKEGLRDVLRLWQRCILPRAN